MEEMGREKQRKREKREERRDQEHLILMGLQSSFQVSLRLAVLQCLNSRFTYGFQGITARHSSLEPAR